MTDVEDLRYVLLGALIDRDKRIRDINHRAMRADPSGLSGYDPYIVQRQNRINQIVKEFDDNFEIIRKDRTK